MLLLAKTMLESPRFYSLCFACNQLINNIPLVSLKKQGVLEHRNLPFASVYKT